MQRERSHSLFARKALTDQGWQSDVMIHIDDAGVIDRIEQSSQPKNTPAFDLVLPGMANVHSHAFQRAMAGRTEIASGKGKDNFWSWREVMYECLRNFTPDDIERIAQQLYIELLKQGYTAIGEFHYVHHDSSGKAYANSAELSDRIMAAAQSTGMHMTLLPVMYETGNFGGAPANEGQKRFLHEVDAYLKLLETLVTKYGTDDNSTLGVAPHSLRAVTPDSLHTILDALPSLGLADCPVHIHVAEQEKEVADCLSWSGKRPVEWLLDNADVNKRWCLIHATHSTQAEATAIAKSGATVGLCPTTEANLGDGIFPMEHFLQQGGKFGIGSDSNMCVSPWEELRLMEYAQRLTTRKRNVLYTTETPSIGRTLFTRAAQNGTHALGMKAGVLAPGYRADIVAVSMDHPLLANAEGDAILDTLIFAVSPCITDVFVGGYRVIEKGRHRLEK